MDEADIVILRGTPSQAEAQAIQIAIARLVAEDRARAARAGGPSPWTSAARLEGARRPAEDLRGSNAWRVAGRLSAPITHLQPGRGDAR